ncbi:MAG: 6-bladed beta-propeller, partial [Odoribacteraceae bacterium]|nr:6-bladed beta-propeller [Odoribacteraceae bacterium]
MGADVIYILDKRSSSIVMFDVNGNYLNQLDRRGNGP